MSPDSLLKEVNDLREFGYEIEALEERGMFNLTIANFPLPKGYSKKETDLLIMVPISYPNGKPDMFWVDEDVLLENGQVPQKADCVESHLNKKWRRFSWHLGNNWNPGRDNLHTYICFIETGLLKAREK